MEIGDWPAAGYFSQLIPELRQLGLESNLVELQAFGFTVLSPEQVGAHRLRERLLQTVLDISERRSGVRPDLTGGKSHRGMVHPLGQLMRFVLWEDRAIEELLMNPSILGIVTWMLGPTCILSLCNAMLRGPGDNCIPLHTDEGNRTMPLHTGEMMTVNATFLLTDYTQEGGALGFLPGSHRWRRDPTPSEVGAFADQMIPIEAPAGSVVIWGDHMWHGAFPRTIAGLRSTLFFNFARHHLQTQEPYRDTCTQEALDRNPRRFAMLMDQFGLFPFREEDVDFARGAERDGYLSLFDRQPTRGSITLRSALPARSVPVIAQPTASPLALAPVPTAATKAVDTTKQAFSVRY
jgi:ectoine hydroxylase-related dioxygenase (phytanoyl-CoA dioxygenase family)